MTDKGCIKRDGWIVTWDHFGPGQLVWECRQEGEPNALIARRDDGWRVAQKGFATADHEVLLSTLVATTLVEEEGWIELESILEEAAS